MSEKVGGGPFTEENFAELSATNFVLLQVWQKLRSVEITLNPEESFVKEIIKTLKSELI